MDTAEILRGTKEYLQAHGRHRGSCYNPNQRDQGCLIGTISKVAGTKSLRQEVGEADLVSWLERLVPADLAWGPRRPIVNFNDFHATDQDVYDLLDKALAELGGL